MSRTHARSLVLVNWNGVFYHRYRLDRHVTALEGVNGAGKTTVMVAAYIALMPDKTHLRFNNVGETGAAGGERGVWGRLGELHHPSYTLLEFALADGRALLAGVHIARRARPEFDLTPFTITGLDPRTPLQDVLLWQQDGEEGVPEPAELADQVAAHGGRLQTFPSAKDYFAALFDAGVTPLRLASAEERAKYDELLHTSMTGGISRALTSDFRTFLLRAETGLADTLGQMRANLKACRDTRREVEHSRRLEAELRGVHAAGERMFAAGLFATRERAEEMARRLGEATARRDELDARCATLRAGLIADDERHRAICARLEADRAARIEAIDVRDRTARACALADRVAELEAQGLALAGRLAEAHAAREAAARDRARRREVLAAAESTRDAAAEGVAEKQAGLDLAHRRAHAHRNAVARLAEAAAHLGRASIAADALEPTRASAHDRRAAIDAARSREARRIDDAERHREAHRRAYRALQAIEGAPVPLDEAAERARDALRRLDRMSDEAARVEALTAEAVAAQARAERQRRVVADARALAVADAAGLRAALDEAEADQADARDARRAAEREGEDARRAADDAETRRAALAERGARWGTLRRIADGLARRFECPVDDRAGVEGLRDRCRADRDALRDDLAAARGERSRLHREAQALAHPGGQYAAGLLDARDRVTGTLLAEAFEDEPVERAAVTQARLGPLARAIVVDDPRRAAIALADGGVGSDDVWLVESGAVGHLVAAADVLHTGAAAVAVDEAYGVRVSRVPERPTLGQRAREARRAALLVEVEAIDGRVEALDTRLRRVESGLIDLDRLVAGMGDFEAGDPAPAIAEALARRDAAEARIAREAARAEEAGARLARATDRVSALRALLPDAALLDPPDLAAEAETLAARRDAAIEARRALSRLAAARATLTDDAAALGEPPLSAEAVAAHRAHLDALDAERDRLFHALGALDYVLERREALAWTDAQAVLDDQTDLLAELRRQLERAKAEVEAARRARDAAEAAVTDAVEAVQAVQAEVQVNAQTLGARRDELEGLAVPEPSEAALAAARRHVDDLDARIARDDADERALATDLAVRRNTLEEAERQREEATSAVEGIRKEAEPARERWRALRAAAEAQGVLDAGLAPTYHALFAERGNIQAQTEARNAFDLLLDRLGHAEQGAALKDRLAERLPTGASASGELYLELWLDTRAWLLRRLPVRFADTADLPDALRRLGEHLVVLHDRLDQHVADLQSESQSVARGIEVSIRRANSQRKKLNAGLRDVRFGGIDGIEIRLEREPRMQGVLEALRSGAAQTDLFRTDLPIEEAFEEIFRRHGGRRGDGQRLLDYREYVRLDIRVKRRNGQFETVNPNQVSTGEAIGVGASLMMVVLTAWENDANLLRRRRAEGEGTLRFLFLDEANRLSHDSLDVLFELCRTLELQLLLAAPEVARADGNTTHHLARGKDAAGRERVVVTARKVRADGSDAISGMTGTGGVGDSDGTSMVSDRQPGR